MDEQCEVGFGWSVRAEASRTDKDGKGIVAWRTVSANNSANRD